MKKYVCTVCGYVYDPEAGAPDHGIAPGTAWEDVPDDFVCPECGVGKDMFEEEQYYRNKKRGCLVTDQSMAVSFIFFRTNTRHYT